MEACKKIKDSGVTPISLYTADDAWYTCNLFTYLAAGYAGVDALNKGGDINTEQMKAAAAKLKEFWNYTTGDAIGANYSVAMNNFTSEESVKQLTLEGAVFLSPKLDMEDPDVQGTGGLLGEYVALNANAEVSTVNIQRNLSTAAKSKRPSLLEELALDRLTPDAFIEQLAAENK